MSGGAVLQRALAHLVSSGCNHPSVVKALGAAENGPRQLAYDLGVDARLPREVLLDRAAGVFLSFACLNLTDDLQDGDAGAYLASPAREGPAVQLLLQCQALALLAGAGVTPADLARVGRDLAVAAVGQLDEIVDAPWTALRYREVGERIAGLQYAAYATLMWSGTELAPDARAVGTALGFAAHVAEDLRSEDRRLTSLSAAERGEILDLARGCVEVLAMHRSSTARRAAEAIRLDPGRSRSEAPARIA